MPVIERAPFRITVTDGDGTTALRQVANTRAQPFLAAPSPTDPQPGGGTRATRRCSYAPLTFTVGARDQTEYPTTPWNGNVLLNLQGGVQHSAHDVEAVQVVGEAARLTSARATRRASSSSMSRPGRGATIRVSAKVDAGRRRRRAGRLRSRRARARRSAASAAATTGSTSAAPRSSTGSAAEHGRRAAPAGAPAPIPGGGGEEYLFPSGPHGAYYVQSLTYGDRFGFLLDRDELSSWRMASDAADRWQVSVAANAIDYVVAPGSPKRAIGAITALTGRHRVPPEWAVGPQLDRAVLFQGDNAAGHEARVRDDLANIDKHRLPLEAYRIEGWQFFDRAKLRELIAAVRSRGIRPMLYFRAFVGKDEIGTDDTRLYDEAIEKGYVAKTPTGQPYVFVSNFNERAAIIDFTNPEATARGGTGASARRSTSAPRASCRTSASRSSPTWSSPTDAPGRRCTTPTRCCSTARRARPSSAGSAITPAATSTSTRGRATAGRACVGGGELPRRRDDGLEPLGRARVADDQHGQPRRRRGVRLQHRHRRLLRHRPVPADDEGAVAALGRVGGAVAVLPAARLDQRRHARAVAVRRRDRARCTSRSRGCTCRRAR